MSTSYEPGLVPDDAKQLIAFLRQELMSIKQGLEQAKKYDEFVVLYASPTRTRPGMVIYADGTTYDPGSGEGLYRRNAANNAWVHLG